MTGLLTGSYHLSKLDALMKVVTPSVVMPKPATSYNKELTRPGNRQCLSSDILLSTPGHCMTSQKYSNKLSALLLLLQLFYDPLPELPR